MSEELKIKGTIVTIKPIESGTSKAGKAWEKRDFAIQTTGQYPKLVAFTLFGEKTNYTDKFTEGMEVEVKFNVESREFGDKYFTNVNAYSVTGVTQQNTTGGGTNYQSAVAGTNLPPTEYATQDQIQDDSENDLPFS